MIISKVHIVAFGLLLIRNGFDKLDGLHWAGFHTGLLALDAPLFVPVRGVYAKVALGGFAREMVPDGAVGLLGAHSETGLTADAFFLVNSSHIAVLGIHESGSHRAILNTDGGDTLPAWSYLDVIGEFAEGILHDLNAGER